MWYEIDVPFPKHICTNSFSVYPLKIFNGEEDSIYLRVYHRKTVC
jgi:hypothetical protein